MKARCTYTAIKETLHALETIVTKQAALPILQNILIEAKEGVLFFSATNLEIGVIKEVRAKVDEPGSIAMPLEIISSFLGALRGEENVTIRVEERDLFVESGAYKTRIKGFDAKDFPIIPQSTEPEQLEVDMIRFKEILNAVLPFATTNEIRPELTGVYMSFADEVVVAATDSFRLGEKKSTRADLGITKNIGAEEIIIPNKLSAYINRLPDHIARAYCSIKENHLFISCDDLHITARLIDGKYPDYAQIIPHQPTTLISIKKEDLLEAMRVMNVFVGREHGEVQFAVSQDGVFVSSHQQEIGESEVMISASVEGENQEIVVNPRFVFDGLQKIKEDDVFIGITNSFAPILLRGSSEDGVNKDFTYIVMPVKSGNT